MVSLPHRTSSELLLLSVDSHIFFLLAYFKVNFPQFSDLPPGYNFFSISWFFKRNTTFIKSSEFSRVCFSSPLMPLQSLLERLWTYEPLNHIVHNSPISVPAFHLDMCLIMSVLTILPQVLRFPIEGMRSTIT